MTKNQLDQKVDPSDVLGAEYAEYSHIRCSWFHFNNPLGVAGANWQLLKPFWPVLVTATF